MTFQSLASRPHSARCACVCVRVMHASCDAPRMTQTSACVIVRHAPGVTQACVLCVWKTHINEQKQRHRAEDRFGASCRVRTGNVTRRTFPPVVHPGSDPGAHHTKSPRKKRSYLFKFAILELVGKNEFYGPNSPQTSACRVCQGQVFFSLHKKISIANFVSVAQITFPKRPVGPFVVPLYLTQNTPCM